MSVRLIVFPNLLSSDRVIRDVKEGLTVRDAVSTAVPIMNYAEVLVIRNDQRVEVDDTALEDGDTLIVRAVPAGEHALANTIKTVIGVAMIAGGFVLTAFTLGAGAPIGIPLMAMGGYTMYDAISGPTGFKADAALPYNPDTSTTAGSTGIHGGSNSARPYGQVPIVLGKSLISPPLGSKSYTSWDGSTPPNQILNQLFVIGLGRYSIANQKIGDKAMSAFATPPTLNQHDMTNDTYGQIVTEAGVGIELLNGVANIQTTVADIDYIDVDISFPSGLTQYNTDGSRTTSRSVTFTLEYKKTTAGTWTNAAINLTHSGNVTQAMTFNDQISAATLLAAGRAGYTGTWDIRLTRTLADSSDSKLIDKSVWAVVRSYQTKEPISTMAKGITTRIKFTAKATNQLNGAVANFNVEAQSIVPVWDGVATGASHWGGSTALGLPAAWKNVAMNAGGFTWPSWAGNASNNPAALYLWVLRGPINPKPVDDTLIDWPAFEAWYTFCNAPTPPLQVNAVWDSGGPLLRLLSMIAGVGRASPVMRDSKYSIWYDNVQTVPIQHFTPRNSWGFSSVKNFPQVTHAVRAQFIDPASGWKQAEQIVYMPGYGPSTATEYRTMQFWGITDYAQACKQVWYLLAVETLRPEAYQITADLEHVACQQGDLVVVSHDVPMYGLNAGRVLSITVDGGGNALMVTLDEQVTMETGKSYAIRWRRTDGTSVGANVNTAVGTTQVLTFTSAVTVGTVPEAGDLFSFGIQGIETQKMIVVSVVPGDDFTAKIVLNNYDPNVYTADASTPPVWSSGISLPSPVSAAPTLTLSVPNTQAPIPAPPPIPAFLGSLASAPGTANIGDWYYNTTSHTIFVLVGSGWVSTSEPSKVAASMPAILSSEGANLGSNADAISFVQNLAGKTAFISALGADVITLSTTGLIKSSNFVTGTSGFQIKADGTAEFSVGLTVGAWTVQANSLESAAPGTARISLDKTNNRVSVLDSSNAVKTAMGYMGGLSINGQPWDSTKLYTVGEYAYDSTALATYKCTVAVAVAGTRPGLDAGHWTASSDTWSASTYGFWAKAGNALQIDGPVSVSNGDWILGNDSSFLIKNGATVLARLGNIAGQNGLWLNEASAGASYRARMTSSEFFVGNDSAYLRYSASVLTIKGSLELVSIASGGAISNNTGNIKILPSNASGTYYEGIVIAKDAASAVASPAIGNVIANIGYDTGFLGVSFKASYCETVGVWGTRRAFIYLTPTPTDSTAFVAAEFNATNKGTVAMNATSSSARVTLDATVAGVDARIDLTKFGSDMVFYPYAGTIDIGVSTSKFRAGYFSGRITCGEVFPTGDVFPSANNTYNLGKLSGPYRWNYLYCSGIDCAGEVLTSSLKVIGLGARAFTTATLASGSDYVVPAGTYYAYILSTVAVGGMQLLCRDSSSTWQVVAGNATTNMGWGGMIVSDGSNVKLHAYAAGSSWTLIQLHS